MSLSGWIHVEKTAVTVMFAVCLLVISYLAHDGHGYIIAHPMCNATVRVSSRCMNKNASSFVSTKWQHPTVGEKYSNPHFFGYIINKPYLCSSAERDIPAVIVVISSSEHFLRRKAIRKTWGRAALIRDFKLVFLLGNPNREDIQAEIIIEDSRYSDIIQGNFEDVYRNLTLKSVTMVRWVKDNCARAQFMLKIDDDMVLNLWDFSSTLRKLKREGGINNRTIWGNLIENGLPFREPRSKWYVSRSWYPNDNYPSFITGAAYLISRSSVSSLYKLSAVVPFLYLEDVFLTGLVAAKAGINRMKDEGFGSDRADFVPCKKPRIIASHDFVPEDMERTWTTMVSRSPGFLCETER